MINKLYLKIILVIFFIFSVGAPIFAHPLKPTTVGNMAAQDKAFLDNAGYYNASPGSYRLSVIIATVIKTFLSLLGLIFIILIIYSGYNWMTAGGQEEKVSRARNTIYRAVIGLIIIIAAYAITEFVFTNLDKAGVFGPGGGSGSGGGSSPYTGPP